MEVNKALINFTYAFLPVAGEMTYDKSVLDSFINSGGGKWGKPDSEPATIFQSRKGLSSYLLLESFNTMGYEILPSIEGNVKQLDLTISIYPVFRFFNYGASLTFHLIVESEKNEGYFLKLDKLYQLLQLISTEKNEKAKQLITLNINKSDEKNLTIFELFNEIVNKKLIEANNYLYKKFAQEEFNYNLDSEDYIIDFKECISELNYESKLNYCEIFSNYLNKINPTKYKEIDNTKIYPFVENNHINLLCRKYLSNSTTIEINVPWVSIALELDPNKKAYKTFCKSYQNIPRNKAVRLKMNGVNKYESKIAPFLYRAVDENYDEYKIEPSYDNYSIKRHFNGFENMYVDARLYIHLSRRSILLITDSFGKNPGKYILPTLLDLSELTHTRWQSLIILNRILDTEIKFFANHKYDLLKPKEKIDIIIQMVKKSIISLEDPTSYVISGDSLREIHETLKETFKLNELQISSMHKIEMLEKLYNYSLSFD